MQTRQWIDQSLWWIRLAVCSSGLNDKEGRTQQTSVHSLSIGLGRISGSILSSTVLQCFCNTIHYLNVESTHNSSLYWWLHFRKRRMTTFNFWKLACEVVFSEREATLCGSSIIWKAGYYLGRVNAKITKKNTKWVVSMFVNNGLCHKIRKVLLINLTNNSSQACISPAPVCWQ